MKTGAIIFSRMRSKRFPGKAMRDISGKPLIQRVLERTQKIKLIDHICIATSDLEQDDIISNYAISKGIDLYRGDEDDVAMRAFKASTLFKYDCFVRICGDRPFFDGKIVDEMIKIHKTNKNDLTTNMFPRIVPCGLTVEIINVSTLSKIINETKDRHHREHLTSYIYDNPNNFKIENIESLPNLNFDIQDLDITVDTIDDIEKIEYVARELTNLNQYNDFHEVIDLLKKYKKYDYTRNT